MTTDEINTTVSRTPTGWRAVVWHINAEGHKCVLSIAERAERLDALLDAIKLYHAWIVETGA